MENEIKEIVDRETRAWNTQDVNLFLSIFHKDMVWPWPPNNKDHDPINWEFKLGKFDYKRWKTIYVKFFKENELIYNDRKIVKIKVSKEGDGAIAVVDIDTLWEDVITKSGFMKDAFQFVYGGKETGKMLIDASPDKIHFTGSVATGKKIMEQASKQLIPVELELGGKDPAIVFEDVNLERTVNGVMWAAFTNSGQSCTSIERAYIHESIYDKFVNMIVEKSKKLRLPSAQTDYKKSDAYDLGGITSAAQITTIEKHIQDAVQKGAKVLLGGKREGNSRQFPPTILTDVDHTMLIMTEETFGPVLPIMKFKTEEEAIKLANDSVYGLSASVWSKDVKRAERVAKKILTGNVSINSHMLTEGNPALPFGGIKDSGIGRSKGKWGLLGFTNVKSIIIDQQSSRIEAHWYPFTQTKYELLSKLMVALFSKSKNLLKFAMLGLKMDSLGTKEKIN